MTDHTAVVCGMSIEWSIATKCFPHATVIQLDHTKPDLSAADDCQRILSFGYAGGLVPGYPVTQVCYPIDLYPGAQRVDQYWNYQLRRLMGDHYTKAAHWFSNGIENQTNTSEQKAAFSHHGDVIDDETFYVANYAAKRGIPWTAFRVISDDFKTTLPPVATVGLNPNGSLNLRHALVSIVERPGQIASLGELGIDMLHADTALWTMAQRIAPNIN